MASTIASTWHVGLASALLATFVASGLIGSAQPVQAQPYPSTLAAKVIEAVRLTQPPDATSVVDGPMGRAAVDAIAADILNLAPAACAKQRGLTIEIARTTLRDFFREGIGAKLEWEIEDLDPSGTASLLDKDLGPSGVQEFIDLHSSGQIKDVLDSIRRQFGGRYLIEASTRLKMALMIGRVERAEKMIYLDRQTLDKARTIDDVKNLNELLESANEPLEAKSQRQQMLARYIYLLSHFRIALAFPNKKTMLRDNFAVYRMDGKDEVYKSLCLSQSD